MLRKTAALLLASSLVPATTAKLTLIDDYWGLNFFDHFDFFSEKDPTNGHVKYVDLATANSTGLAGIIIGGPEAGSVYLGVDSSKKAPEGRESIRVSSKKTYNNGIYIADIGHMPGGICGTWPAYWLLGTSKPWPAAGEVDIIEGVNDQIGVKSALHVEGEFKIKNDSKIMTAFAMSDDCAVDAPDQAKNMGCVLHAYQNSRTYGNDFNAKSGGVYAAEYAANGMSVWFFPRDQIPLDITAGVPEPSFFTWGLPLANFTGDRVNFKQKFSELQIVFNTAFCGDWAGNPEVWKQSSCSKLAPTCEEYVSDNPEAFKEAYWAIRSVKVYENKP